MQRSTVMAIMHLMRRQMSDKAVANGLAVHLGRSVRTLKMNFTEPVTFGFFWFFNGRTVHA
jgi:transcriptional regulator GlxA family with amidase domain